mmetsp:Transcript_11485/g.30964  ORF Transcript_11485/g.30964 Transcript_11485/m.30964 type:complete len:92 (+) Transcript_11485:90-365(+)
MKTCLVLAATLAGGHGFQHGALRQPRSWTARSPVQMVATPDRETTPKRLANLDKVNLLKVGSNSLREPISSEMANDEILPTGRPHPSVWQT